MNTGFHIDGKDKVVEWFGKWPTFRDAELLELHLDRRGASWIKLHAWNISEQANQSGCYLAERHAVVTFHLSKLQNMHLFSLKHQSTVSRLEITPTKSGYRMSLAPSVGRAGYLEAEKISISITPGKP